MIFFQKLIKHPPPSLIWKSRLAEERHSRYVPYANIEQKKTEDIKTQIETSAVCSTKGEIVRNKSNEKIPKHQNSCRFRMYINKKKFRNFECYINPK